MRLTQFGDKVMYYLDVEPEYKEPTDGIGEQDAVSFVIGQVNEEGHQIDSVVSVSVENARKFAEAILKVCDEIEEASK